MLKIRLQRVGRKNDPSFRLIVTEHTTAAKKPGSFQELLGSYDARSNRYALKTERIQYWMSKGAQVSGTAHNLLVTAKLIEGAKINVLPKRKPKAEAPAPTPTVPAAEEPAETPTEELATEPAPTEESAPAELVEEPAQT